METNSRLSKWAKSEDSQEEKDTQFKNNVKALQKNTGVRLSLFQSQISLSAWGHSRWL